MASKIAVVAGAMYALKKSFDFLADCVKSFASFDDQMVSVAKTTGMVGEELQGLRDDISSLADVCPASSEELAQIATVAGQLGIQGRENILEFTRVINMMATATEMTAEEAATSMAKVLASFQLPISEVENLGSVINELSNITASTSREIVGSMTRAAASGAQLGLLAEDVAALSATLVSLGTPAERAGTQLNRAFLEAAENVDKMAKQMGISASDMKKAMEEDMMGAILEYIEYLNKLPSNIDRVTKAQEVFGSTGGKAIGKLSTGYEQLTENLNTSHEQIEEGTSLFEEYGIAVASFSNTLKILSGQFGNIKQSIGESLSEPLLTIAQSIQNEILPAFRQFGEMIGELNWDEFSIGVNACVSSFGSLMNIITDNQDVFQTLLDAIGNIIGGIGLLITAFTNIGVAINGECEKIANDIQTLVEVFDAFFEGLKTGNWIDAGKNISSAIKEGLDESKRITTETVDTINRNWDEFYDNIHKPFDLSEQRAAFKLMQDDLDKLKEYGKIDLDIDVDEMALIDRREKMKEIFEQVTGEPLEIPVELTVEEFSKFYHEKLTEWEKETGKVAPDLILEPKLRPNTLQDTDAYKNYIEQMKGLSVDIPININMQTVEGKDMPSMVKSLDELSVDRKVSMKLEVADVEDLKTLTSEVDKAEGIKIVKIDPVIDESGEIVKFNVQLGNVPDEKVTHLKAVSDFEEVTNFNNIIAGIKREVLVNIGVAFTGEEEKEEVERFIDTPIPQKLIQIGCSILGKERLDWARDKIIELEHAPAEMIKKLIVETYGEDAVENMNEKVNLMPQEKITKYIMQITGEEEVEDELKNTEDKAKNTDLKIPDPDPVKITYDYEKLTAEDLAPSSVDVDVNFNLKNKPKMPVVKAPVEGSMKTGGGVPKTGLYLLHEGEEVIPNDKVLGSYQAGTAAAAGGVAAAGAGGAGAIGLAGVAGGMALLGGVVKQGISLFKAGSSVMKDMSSTTKDANTQTSGLSNAFKGMTKITGDSTAETSQFTEVIKWVIDFVKSFIGELKDKFMEFITLPFEAPKAFFNELAKITADFVMLPFTVITDTVNSLAKVLLDFVSLPLSFIIETVKNISDVLVKFITLPFGTIIDTVHDISNAFKDLINLPFKLINDMVGKVIDSIKEVLMLPITQLTKIFDDVIGKLIKLISLPFDIIADSIGDIADKIIEFVSLPFSTIVKIVGDIADILVKFVTLPFQSVIDLVNEIVGGLKDIALIPFELISGGITKTIDKIKEFIKFPIKEVIKPLQDIRDKLVEFITLPLDTVINGFSHLASSLTDALSIPFDLIIDASKKIVEALADFIALPFKLINSSLTEISKRIIDFALLPLTLITDSIKKIADTLIDFVALPLTATVRVITKIVDTITDFALLPFTQIIDMVNDIADAFASLLTSPIDELIDIIVEIFDIFKDLILPPIREFVNLLNNIIDPIRRVHDLFEGLLSPLSGLMNVVGMLSTPSKVLGGLPSFDKGGFVPSDMIAKLHKGEYVLPHGQIGNRTINMTFSPTISKEVDSDVVIDQLLRRLAMAEI